MASENFEIIDGYLYYYSWAMGELVINSRHGMIIMPSKLSLDALFVGYRSPRDDVYDVSPDEGFSENGLVWYREPPVDGAEPGDQYTIRKAFADEIERKIFELGNRIDKLKEEKEKMINGE